MDTVRKRVFHWT